jgi:hypothetical protein
VAVVDNVALPNLSLIQAPWITVYKQQRVMTDLQSVDDGYEAGYSAGYQDGYDQGFSDGYAAGVAAGGSSDESSPVVEMISPIPGAAPGSPGGFPADPTEAARTAVILRIYDFTPGVQYACVCVVIPEEIDGSLVDREDVVYRRGQFRGPYLQRSTQRVYTQSIDSADAGVVELTIRRTGGWPTIENLRFRVDALDADGNLTEE